MTMQLDDLQTMWSDHGKRLDQILSINEHVLRDVTARKLRWSLTPYLLWRAVEMMLVACVVTMTAIVLSKHLVEARYLMILPVVVGFGFYVLAMTGQLMHRAMGLDASGRVRDMQSTIETMKLSEFRLFKWSLLGGTVLWLPIALILFEALTGVAALAKVDLAWLLANVIVGLIVLAFGQYLAKKHVEREDLKPAMRRLIEMVSGRQLRAITRHLEELAALADSEGE